MTTHNPSPNANREFDVVIWGGGIAGLAAAISLRRLGYSVAVIERSNYERTRPGEHLPPSGVRNLEKLGLSDVLNNRKHSKCYRAHSAWWSDTFRSLDYISSHVGHGYNLRRPQFDRDLFEVAETVGAEIFLRAKPVTIAAAGNQWQTHFFGQKETTTLASRFVVDATGRSASLARKLDATLHVADDLVAVSTQYFSSHQMEPGIFVESSDDGWWYCAVFCDGEALLSFFTDLDIYSRKFSKQKHDLERNFYTKTVLYSKFGGHVRFENASLCSSRTQYLSTFSGKGWVAIGDAAMSFDPLSSAGISKALAHGILSASTIDYSLDGYAGALEIYGSKLRNDFSSYLEVRNDFYSIKTKDDRSGFWTRRRMK
ncbi:flavin-dependent dehydrogenase [Labrenzia sp. EL_195]|nr:flavin-dependent dehydrogenase [Labrenzia sp. EL_195]